MSSSDQKLLRYARKEKWAGHYFDDVDRVEGIKYDYSVYDNSIDGILYDYFRGDNDNSVVLQLGIAIIDNGIKIESSDFEFSQDGHVFTIKPSGSLEHTSIIEFKDGTQDKFFLFKAGKLFSTSEYTNRTATKSDTLVGDSSKYADLIASPLLTESRLVLFVGNQDIDELVLHGGYITDKSKYLAPFMYDSGRGYWINYGKIYGFVELIDMKGNFFMSFTRDFDTGELTGVLTRTTFIPTHEKRSKKESQIIVNNEKLYQRFYTNEGIPISKAKYLKNKRDIKTVLDEVMIPCLSNMTIEYL